MKKRHGFLLILLAVGIGLIITYINDDQTTFVESPPDEEWNEGIPEIKPERSAIGNKENPQARMEYDLAMQLDPQTGQLPENIRRKELEYAASIPKRQVHEFRTSKTYEEDWSSIGPYNVGGRTRAISIDVSEESIILAGGVSGGMWRSEDDGNSWTKTTVPENIHSVSCLAQDTRAGKENVWYYGTGEFTGNSASKKSAPYRGDGVFKSVDGGNTWIQLPSTAEGVLNNYNSQFQYIWRISPNPNNVNEDEVFLATVGAIFRSLDGGLSWEVVLGRKALSSPETDLNNSTLSDFADIHQTAEGIYYAVLSQQARNGSSPDRGVYRSVDGVTWVNITSRNWPRNFARTIMASPGSDPDQIYFSVNADEEMLWKYTYLSGDGSGSRGLWENLSENLPAFGGDVGDYESQNSYNMVLAVHPDHENMVYLGGKNLYRSTDGFSSIDNITWIGGYDTANNISIFPNHFVDQHGLVFYPSGPDKMLSTNDGGVFVTNDNTSQLPQWKALNRGFVTTQFYTLGLDEFGSKGDIMGGLQDNGTLLASDPVEVSSWNLLLAGDGGYSAITKDAKFHYASFQFGKIYRFTLDKNHSTKSFTRIDPVGSGGEDELLFVNPYVLAPENQHIMYFAGGDVIWRNSNTSQIPLYSNNPTQVNWEKLDQAISDHGTISAMNATYNPAGLVYYGASTGEVYRINDASSSNYSVDEITASIFPENAYVSCIAVDRKDSKNIIIAFSNYNVISLFYSTDGGDSFENISGSLEENPDGTGSGPSVRWVEIVSKNDGSSLYFAGTTTGVYSTSALDGINTDWQQEDTESIGNTVVTMIKYFSEDGTIVAATHGNGMYQARLSDVWKTEIETEKINQLAFGDAYPNPFVESVQFPFKVPRDGMVRARIYDALGHHVKTILWAEQYKGESVFSWDGTNETGTPVISGTYICRLEFEDQKIGSRVVYLR